MEFQRILGIRRGSLHSGEIQFYLLQPGLDSQCESLDRNVNFFLDSRESVELPLYVTRWHQSQHQYSTRPHLVSSPRCCRGANQIVIPRT